MKNRIRQIIHAHTLVESDQAIVIAVSGGSDSVALLHILSTLYPDHTRIAVYIDHGLRPRETDAEKKLVQELAASCSAKFIAIPLDVTAEQKAAKCSLEEAARNLRYQALETIRNEYNAQCIAVGHTRDDQAEEVLLRLIRGSGSAGLGGMAYKRDYIIRPLLQQSKIELRHYLKAHSLAYCEDSSNKDTRFLRNRIRHHLLPSLKRDYNSSMEQTLIQTASILHEENRLLEDITDAVFQRVCTTGREKLTLALAKFAQEHIAIQRRIVEKICWQMSAKPSFKQISALQNLLHSPNSSEIHLARGLRAIKQQGTILFHYPVKETGYRGSAIAPRTFSPVTIKGPGTTRIPELGYELKLKKTVCRDAVTHQKDTLLLDSSSVSFPLTLRRHNQGERFQPLGSGGSKKIARFLTDQKIPATDKTEYPVLLAGTTVLAVAGLRIDHKFRVRSSSTECLQLHWLKTDNSNLL